MGYWGNETVIGGPDLSSHKGDVDWAKLEKGFSGKDRYTLPNRFALFRATEGQDFVDSKVFDFAAGAKAAGVPFGVYHIPTADFNGDLRAPDVKGEMNDFMQVLIELKRRGLTPELIPFLDIEPGSKKDWMSKEDFTIWVQTWLSGIAIFLESYGDPARSLSAGRMRHSPGRKKRKHARQRKRNHVGRKPGVYISQYLAGKFLEPGHGLGQIYPLWVIDYEQSPPRMPHGWSSPLVWQQNNHGTCDGVDSDNVDINIAQSSLLRK